VFYGTPAHDDIPTTVVEIHGIYVSTMIALERDNNNNKDVCTFNTSGHLRFIFQIQAS